MRFQMDSTALVKAIRAAKKFTGGRYATLPILGSIMIVASKSDGGFSHVRFKATDLETSCDFWQEVHVIDEGIVVVPVKAVLAALKKLKTDLIVESSEEFGVTFRDVHSEFKITVQGSPPEDFPVIPEHEPTTEQRVPSASLYRALNSVAYAASTDESRYNLNGVMVDADAQPTVQCVATDGHRLAIADAGPVSLPWSGRVIIPLASVKLLLPLMFKTTEVCMSKVDKLTIKVSGDGWSVCIRLIDGEYPNYEQVIPKCVGDTVRVNRRGLVDALASMMAVAPERSCAVKFTIGDEEIKLETNNPDLGHAETQVPCERATGQGPLNLAFNGRYLMDALSRLENPQIEMKFKDKGSPVRLTEQYESHPLYVVMPMRV